MDSHERTFLALEHQPPDDIRAQVKRLADVLGADGGYVFCTSHNIQADTSVANVQALLAAYAEFGRS